MKCSDKKTMAAARGIMRVYLLDSSGWPSPVKGMVRTRGKALEFRGHVAE